MPLALRSFKILQLETDFDLTLTKKKFTLQEEYSFNFSLNYIYHCNVSKTSGI